MGRVRETDHRLDDQWTTAHPTIEASSHGNQLPPQPIETVPHLSGGKWTESRSKRGGDVFNPSTGQVIGRVPFATAEQTGRGRRSRRGRAAGLGETPVVERARLMFRFRALLEQHFEELAALVTREHGKTLAEARAEVNRGIEVVEFACGIPSLITGEMLPNIAGDVDAETVRHPVGVCVGITPYNFPFMVPLWMFPIALTCGNTFVLKPSEKVPLSSVRLGELLDEAGLPDGVFNIVHGDRECVDALLDHPQGRGDLVRRLDGDRQVHLRTRHRSTASACNRPAARRTTSSSCPTPSWIRP